MVCFSITRLGFRSRGKVRTLPETVHRVELPGGLGGLALGGIQSSPGLVVLDTASSRAIQQWNDRNPNQRIEVGHAVLDINGITDPKGMLEELQNATFINMLINTELSREQRQLLKRSMQLHNKSKALEEILQPVGPDAILGDVCAICHDDMEPGSKVAQLPCGHQFHHNCGWTWLVHGKPRCPLCNHDLQENVCCAMQK